MAFVSHASANQSIAFKGLVVPKAAFSRGMEAYIERHSRSREIASLHAMTDAQLATIGVKRDEIVSHVFRDKFYM